MPQRERQVELQFPLAGLHRRFAQQAQPPYTTDSCQNVRPRDCIEGRLRGGSRPGLKHLTETGDLATQINGLLVTEPFDGSSYRQWAEEFSSPTLGRDWGPLTLQSSATTYAFPELSNGVARSESGIRGAVRTPIQRLDAAKPRSIEMLVDLREGEGATIANSYYLFARVPSGVGYQPEDIAGSYGVLAQFYFDGTDVQCDLYGYLPGTNSNDTGSLALSGLQSSSEFWVTLSLEPVASGAGLVARAHIDGRLVAETGDIVTANLGDRFGFALAAIGSSVPTVVSAARCNYHETIATQSAARQIIALAGNDIYAAPLDLSGSFVQQASSLLVESASRRLRMAQYYGNVLIADYGNVVAEGDNGRIQGTTGDKALVYRSTNLSYAWEGATPTNLVMELFNVQGVEATGAWPIVSINTTHAGAVELDDDFIQIPNGEKASCSYRLRRAPKVYSLQNATMTRWLASAGKGYVPLGCHIVGIYRDRVFLADDRVVYFSRSGDPFDWDFGGDPDDAGRATAITLSSAGLPPQQIVAVIPGMDDYLYIAGTKSLMVLRGDITLGGQVDPVERVQGIRGPDAWCYGPSGEIFYLGREGLMRLLPPPYRPEPVSRTKLPRELLVQDALQYTKDGPMLAHDVESRGINIFFDQGQTNIDQTELLGYFVDFDSFGFWPEYYRGAHYPFAIANAPDLPKGVTASTEWSRVLLAGRDGKVRVFHSSSATDDPDDDDSDINNNVFIGPIRVGDGLVRDGILRRIRASLGNASGAVTWSIHAGKTAEAAIAASASASGTFAAGLSNWQPTRVAGPFIYVKLAGSGSTRWAMEQAAADFLTTGGVRNG